MEIKKAFSGYFIHPLRRFRDFGMRSGRKSSDERSVVRPTYSYLGRYFITERSILDIIGIVASQIPELDSVARAYINIRHDGVIIDVSIIVKFGHSIIKVAETFQQKVAKEVDIMTSLNIIAVDIDVKGLMWEVAD
jgi:uncharacterized alkaline shock family protein YloU